MWSIVLAYYKHSTKVSNYIVLLLLLLLLLLLVEALVCYGEK